MLGLLIIMLIFPKEGIKITDNFSLQFTSWNDFLKPIKNTDISDILENNQITDIDTLLEKKEIFDSVYIDSVLVVYKPVEISVDSTLQEIEFQEGNDSLLFDFFKELLTIKNTGKRIHILHYGDSQIEVDRMTSYFRYRLQKSFGGYGPGFHSGIQAFNFSAPLVVSYSDNWSRYNLFPRKDSLVTHRRYGLTTTFSMFKSVADTLNEEKTAWIQFRKSPTAYSTARVYNNISLFYGHNHSEVKLEVYDGENIVSSDILPASTSLKIKKWKFDHTPSKLKFVYTGTSSPEIYGYSFENSTGIFVDNISVRGSAGLFFGSMDLALLQQIFNSLNTRLILLQFGGNAVGKDTVSMKRYVKYFGAQIGYLQKIAPNVKIIVIGPGDMSEKHKNNYVTRPKLPFLINKMKEEVLRRNCGFWNMYEAMGGENSMPSWVFHEPALAEKDFVHFSPQGSNIIAQMFYKSLMYEYNKFLNQQIVK